MGCGCALTPTWLVKYSKAVVMLKVAVKDGAGVEEVWAPAGGGCFEAVEGGG